jgi:hypothetical protein
MNIRKALDIFRKEYEQSNMMFLEYMAGYHKQIIDYFNNELRMRKNLEAKVNSIKNLI